MFVQVVVPMTDLRAFNCGSVRLPLPSWPSPSINKHFIRSFGVVRRRRRGGLKGWSAEDSFCDASGIIGAFSNDGAPITYPQPGSVRPQYRRLYSDGQAMVKLELGFDLGGTFCQGVDRLVSNLLRSRLGLKFQGKTDYRPLVFAGDQIAKIYEYSTSVNRGEKFGSTPSYVCAEKFSVVIDADDIESTYLSVPRSAVVMALGPEIRDICILHWSMDVCDQEVGFYYIYQERSHRFDLDRLQAINFLRRNFRLYIARLGTEYSNLQRVLTAIAERKIDPQPYTECSDRLQGYLQSAFRRVARFEKHLNNLSGEDHIVAEAAKRAMAELTPGLLSSLHESVRRLRPRPSVTRKIDGMITRIIVKGDYRVGDQFNNYGTAGIFGKNIHSDHNQFRLSAEGLALKKDLEDLENKIISKAAETESPQALAKVQEAKAELAQGAPERVASIIRSAGSWTLDIVKEIGLPALGELLKSTISSS